MIVSQANFGGPGTICISSICSMSFQTIQGHTCFLPIASCKTRSNEISLCSAGQDGSTDMHIDILPSHHLNLRSRDLRSPKVKIWPWPFGVTKYMFRCVSKREKQWRSNYCSNILRSKVIHKSVGLFHVIDLTSVVNSWATVLKIDTIGFVASLVTHSFFLPSSSSISGDGG